MRSENLLIRPIWPEDRKGIAALAIPPDHRLHASDLIATFVVLQPEATGKTVIGVAGWTSDGLPVSWIPQFDEVGREADDSLVAMLSPLPGEAIRTHAPHSRIAA